jgi:hypothetical protein
LAESSIGFGMMGYCAEASLHKANETMMLNERKCFFMITFILHNPLA